MKLLFDANLSPKLVAKLDELFPASAHVFETGRAKHTSDQSIWNYAAAHGFTIVTADADFLGMSERLGCPPQVVFLQNCNYRTAIVEKLLRQNALRVSGMEQSGKAILVIRSAG